MKALCLLLLAASAASAQTIAIVGGTVHTVDGEVIENGIVLIEDGRIQNVGRSLSIPSNARRLDADGKIVIPGLIDVGTSVGLIEVLSLADTRDASLDNADPFRPSFRVTDGLNPYSIVIPVTQLGGVTTVASLPSGGILAGQAAVIDLTGRRAADMIVREPAALVGAFNPAAAETVGGARGALALRLREALDDARFYGENEDAFGSAALRELSISRRDLETSSSGAARSSTTPDRFDCSSATRTSTADPCNTWEIQHPEKTGLQSPSQVLNALESHQPRTSKMASTSTGWFPGSDAMPTALRPPLPLSSPKTSTSSSLKPLTT